MADLILDDDYKILFENDDVLIVDVLSNNANKYFGNGTPWYTGDDWVDISTFRNLIKDEGKIIYVIDKKTNEKVGFSKYRDKIVYQDEGVELQKDVLKKLQKKFPEASKILDNELNHFPFKVLRKYSKGKADISDLERLDNVYDVVKVDDFRGNDRIILEFDDDEVFFEMAGLSEEDIYFINRIWSGHYEFESEDNLYYDSRDGYGYYGYLQSENTILLKEIAEIIFPNKEFEENSEKYMSELFSFLYENFQRQMDEIFYIIISETNEKASEYAVEIIEKEFDALLKKVGLEIERKFDRFSTSVDNLINLYFTENKKWESIKELLKSVLERENDYMGAGKWGESSYEMRNRASLDYNKINGKINYELETILEKLYDDKELKEKIELVNRLQKDYKFNKSYYTKFEPKIQFEIRDVDSDNKIKVALINPKSSRIRIHSFSEEDFYKFVNNPQIFDIFESKRFFG